MGFLNHCRKKSLPIFLFLCAFISIECLLNYKTIQIHPFQIWGVFSKPVEDQGTYQFYSLEVNNQVVALKSLHNRNKLLPFDTSIKKYVQLQKGDDPIKLSCLQISQKYGCGLEYIINEVFSNTEQVANYPAWLYQYTNQYFDKPTDSLAVYSIVVAYNELNAQTLLSKTKVLSYNLLCK